MIGEREVLVAHRGGLARHLLDGCPAVGPVGMEVEVAAQRGQDVGARSRVGRDLGLEPREVRGDLALQCLLDDPSGRIADAGQLGDLPPCRQLPQLLDGHVPDRVGRPPERRLLVAPGSSTLEQRRDALERLDRVHTVKVPGTCRVHSTATREG